MSRSTLLRTILTAFFIASAAVSLERALFVSRAEATMGEVTELRSQNGSCSSARRRRSRGVRKACTRFLALVGFSTNAGENHQLLLSAGRANGHDASASLASWQVGQRVRIFYDPARPDDAREASFGSIWGLPLFLLFLQLASFLALRARRGSKLLPATPLPPLQVKPIKPS